MSLSLAFAASVGFRVVPSKPEAALGEPIDVGLYAEDPAFNPDRIQRVEFDADPELWHIAKDWQKNGAEAGGAPAAGGQGGGSGAGPKPLWSARINPFETGMLNLPKTRVHYRREGAGANALAEEDATTATIKVAGVRDPKDETAKLVGLRPMELFPRSWRGAIIAAIVILALIAVGYALWRWLPRPGRPGAAPLPPPEPLLPPGAWALREIERLRRLPICASGPAKDIYSMVSEVLRIYLGRRHGFDAIDTTTYECMIALDRRGAPPELRALVSRFLNECDLVKFSKFEPPRDRWEPIWDDAKAIVLASTPAEEIGAAPAAKPEPQPAEATA